VKTLAKEHGLLSASFSGSSWSVQENGTYGNWRLLGNITFISSTYFDLAGMSMEEKTLFFQGAAVQSLAPPKSTNGVPGDSAFILDLMSTSPLTDDQISNYAAFGNFAQPTSTLEFSETVYARIQIFAITQDQGPLAYMVITSDNQTGSMEPTASDRIYSYRLVAPGRIQATGLIVYPARHILSAEAREEPDFQYIMRLKRDYDLQQEPDVD
jgi:hypothetical protein